MERKDRFSRWAAVAVLVLPVLLLVSLVSCGGGAVSSWAKSFGGIDFDGAHSIQQTSDKGYIVAGWTESFSLGKDDFWVLKLDRNGNIVFNPTSGARMTDTTAASTATAVTPRNTTGTASDTGATLQNTSAASQDTNTIVMQQAP